MEVGQPPCAAHALVTARVVGWRAVWDLLGGVPRSLWRRSAPQCGSTPSFGVIARGLWWPGTHVLGGGVGVIAIFGGEGGIVVTDVIISSYPSTYVATFRSAF